MSLTDPTAPGSRYNAVRETPGDLIPLDPLFRGSMEKVKSGFDFLRLNVRCEPLPHIYGQKEAMAELFENLIRMILSSSPPGYKLFLFVGCEEQKDGIHSYMIRFQTNITTDEEWKTRHADALHRCNFIIAGHNGKLQVNRITNTGYLFCLSLPGKMISDAIR